MIREVQKKDERQVSKILLERFPKEIQKNLITELNHAIFKLVEGFVYVENNVILGYIILRKWAGVFWLDTLVVASNSQGKGVGKSLVDFTKNKCMKEKIPQINVCTFYLENLSFYQNLGFVSMGELDGPFMPLDKKRYYLKWILI